MRLMLDIQLGRRNLSPIQRIAVAEKYRPIYEKQALLNKQLAISEARKNNQNNKNEQFSQNSATTVDKIDVRAKLAKTAGVSEKTYRMGAKVLSSDNEDIKQRVLSGETSISAGYKERRIKAYGKFTTSFKKETRNPTTDKKLSDIAGVGTATVKLQKDSAKIIGMFLNL